MQKYGAFCVFLNISSSLMKYCLLLTVLLLMLSACNNTKKEGIIIGVSQCSDDLWRKTMNEEMLREASFYQDLDIKLDIKTVKDNTEQQIKDIEELIQSGVDLLVISPNESKAITPIVEKAYEKGIPVILVDRKIETNKYTAYVGADNYEIGREAALYSAGVLNGKGNIVEIRGWAGSTSDEERHNGFQDGLKTYPGIKVVAERRGNFLMPEARKQMSEILKKDHKIDLVFALNDPMALGVYEASIQYSGKSPYIVGIDALPGENGGIQNIQKGLLDASFIYPTGGDKVIALAVKILKHEEYKRENTLRTAVVDKNNVRTILLQTDQIAEQQAKLEATHGLLNKSLMRYSNQQNIFYATIIILILITTLLVFLILAYRSKSRINALLKKQNEEIKLQAETLAEQKEQLISLSKQLEEATHAKLVFFTNISHEFRTPLSLILGPLDTLMTSGSLTKEQSDLLNLIRRNSNRLQNLISQIIEFRKFENGKMQLILKTADIIAFFRELNVVFEDYAKRSEVNFSFEADKDSLIIPFDQEKIEKIYYNLLSNAFKHTFRNGSVKVTLSLDEKRSLFILSVLNTGTSIPVEKIQNIFDRFYKINLNDTGTGIGLALTSSLVEVHKGKIFVESTDQKGTIFTVQIPVLEENIADEILDFNFEFTKSNLSIQEAEGIGDISILETPYDDEKPIVLVIEDNEDMQQYLKLVLENDYNLVCAYDGNIGIEKAVKYIPDAIISDVMMPEKDGFEVCRILKENVVTSHIPIVLLTACTLDEQKAIGFENGADAYVPKPFNAELLKIRLRKLIESRKKLKEAFGQSLINDSSKVSLADIEQKLLSDFQSYVENHMSEQDLNVDSIASHLGLSRIQLYRKLKSVTSYSPNDLVNVIKLRYAVQLLTVSRKSISEAAYETGFSSPSYFSKIFKKYYNENPTDFLKRTLGN